MSPENRQENEAPDSSAEEQGQDAQPTNAGEDPALVAANAERDQFKSALQHLQADFENYRKRVIKQQADDVARANEALVQKVLPVLDTIDLAIAHEPSKSLEQVSTALLDVLSKEGLERIPSVDAQFDPNEHEAVAHEPGDGESPAKVSEEMRAGYRWKGRVLRPAMVKVIG